MQPLQWTTVQRKVKDLLPVDFNPRTITEEKRQKLERSIRKFNLVEIPVINFDNSILAGHQRAYVLASIGREEEDIDVRYPNRPLTESELKEYMIISNTHAGEFDFDMLEEHFAMLDFSDIGFDLPDFSEGIPVVSMDAEDDGYEIPEEIQTDIVEGDYFEIGPHRLLCGDSTYVHSWDKLCKAGALTVYCFNLVITDPPYNVDYTGGTDSKMKIMNDKMSASGFYHFLFNFYSSIKHVVNAGAPWYIFHADTEGHNFRQAFIDAGYKLSGCLMWLKNSIVMGRSDYQWKHEPVLYGWKPGAPHPWYSDRKQSTVLEFDRPLRNGEHPTMKPISIISYLMNNSSIPGDIVGDGFGGSGTTMVTAHQLQRICFMMELDPKFCQVIIERMLKLDRKLQVKRNGETWYPAGFEPKEHPHWVEGE